MVKRVCKQWADFVLFGEEENWPIYRSGLFSSCQHVWLTDWSCTVWCFDNIMYPFQYNSTNRPLALNFFPRSQVMGSHAGCLLLNNKRTIHTITMTLVTAWCFSIVCALQNKLLTRQVWWYFLCQTLFSSKVNEVCSVLSSTCPGIQPEAESSIHFTSWPGKKAI